MQLQNTSKPISNYLKLVGILSLITIVVLGSLYLYFQVYLTRTLYPNTISSVNEEDYKKRDFKKISNEDSGYSFFVPNNWTEIDQNNQVYSDILNGSMSYIKSYPNSLGPINKELCDKYATEIYNELTKNNVYTNATERSKELRKLNNIDTCILVTENTIANKKYTVRQNFYFTENQIFQHFIQYQTDLNTQKDIADFVENSVNLKL